MQTSGGRVSVTHNAPCGWRARAPTRSGGTPIPGVWGRWELPPLPAWWWADAALRPARSSALPCESAHPRRERKRSLLLFPTFEWRIKTVLSPPSVQTKQQTSYTLHGCSREGKNEEMMLESRHRALEKLPAVTHRSVNVWARGREKCEVSQTQLMGYYMSRDGWWGWVGGRGGAYLTEPGHLWCVDTQRNSRCSPGARRGRLVSRRKVNPLEREREKKKELWGSREKKEEAGIKRAAVWGNTVGDDVIWIVSFLIHLERKVSDAKWSLKDLDVYSVRRTMVDIQEMISSFFQPASGWFHL